MIYRSYSENGIMCERIEDYGDCFGVPESVLDNDKTNPTTKNLEELVIDLKHNISIMYAKVCYDKGINYVKSYDEMMTKLKDLLYYHEELIRMKTLEGQ